MATKTTPTKPASDEAYQRKNLMTHSGFFLGALLLHLIVILMVATWVIFPAFHPPVDDFARTYVGHSAPPPPPPPPQPQTVPTHTVSPPTQTIVSSNPTPQFNIPLPDFSHTTAPDAVKQTMQQKVTTNTKISDARLTSIRSTVQGWGRDANNIRDSNSDPRAVVATFPVYLASYADGDWSCNVRLSPDGKVDGGSLPNLVAKINEWTHGKIKAEVVPQPLSIGGPELLSKKPPFIFFTGHKNFVLTNQEITNLRDYLQVGGCIWGDNALPGRGSRFDVAFRREMKRVIPDEDKNFEPLPMTHEMFDKMGYYQITKVPSGINFYAEPLEHLDIDGKLAIIYVPNDYSDMWQMKILPGDNAYEPGTPDQSLKPHQLYTPYGFDRNKGSFYRNFTLPSCLATQQFGLNVIAYMLVRFDKELQEQ